jgi:serine/threonine protein kinase/tetratricopeptide (TPR) repeat protein
LALTRCSILNECFSAIGGTIVGTSVSHYEILEQLGRGGMGVVYKARDVKLDRFVALKFLPPDLTRDIQAKERFIREARTASSFDHPNICTVYEIGETDRAQSFIAMPCYEGETLKRKIERAPLTIEEATGIALQVAQGLSTTHAKDIIHRDIKPANIIVTTEGVAKILDFGLAKLRGQSVVTKTGSTVGTVAYMSPEQAKGDPVDQRTDVWSLGVVLHEMLTGDQPFRGEYDQVVLYSILNQEPPALKDLRPDVPPGIQAIVAKCLEKDPDRRFQSMAELEKELSGRGKKDSPWAASFSLAGHPAAHPPPASLRRKSILLVASVLLIGVLLLLFPFRRQAMRLLGVDSGISEKHVAILADTANSTNAAFCMGMVEVLTEWVARHRKSEPMLSVIPSNELQKDGVTTASEARKAFGATLAITVRTRAAGLRQRLILNLIDARTLSMLNSEEVEASGDAIMSLETLAQSRVAELLGMRLPASTEGTTPGEPVSSRAYDYYLQGRGFLQRYDRMDRVDSAAVMFRNSLKEDSSYALARAGLAEAYWRMYDLDKDSRWALRAGEESSRAMASGKQISGIYATAGLISAGTGNYGKAVTEFGKAVALDPDNAEAAGGLGRAYDGLNDPQRAETEYRKAIEIQPSSWTSYNQLGRFYASHGRYEEAIEPFRQVIRLLPGNTHAYSNLGGIYVFLGRYAQAENVLEQSIAIEPTYMSLSNLATCYYKERKFPDAAEKIEAALKLNDRDYRVWGNLASIYLEMPGKRDTAIGTYRRAIEKAKEQLTVKPDDPIVLAELAGYYSEVGLHDAAIATVKKALALAPGEGEVLFLAGCISEEKGDRTSALAYIKQSLERGYSYREIEDYPGLDKLRKDKRFLSLKPLR